LYGHLKFKDHPLWLVVEYIFQVSASVLYTLSDNPIYLVCVQVLDGIGAGILLFALAMPETRKSA